MTKFNNAPSIKREMESHPDAYLNNEGGLEYYANPCTDLYLRAASCLVGENKFYESADFADSELIRATHKVLRTDPEFVLQLAVYLREQMYLRSVPLVLCAEYANVAPGTVKGARQYIARVIRRADELTEIIAYQFARNKLAPRKAKLPMAIKSGVAMAFPKYGEYALGKYNRKSTVTLKDALRLTHPKPRDAAQQKLWDDIVAGTLASPVTWETQRSTGRMNWSEVIHQVFNKDGKTMNLMAQLRNLRNIMKSEDVTNEDIALVCKMISDPEAVRKSKQLPFRFLAAYRTIRYGMHMKPTVYGAMMHKGDTQVSEHPMVNSVLDALENAAAVSTENIPKLPGTTLIACDVSGSMMSLISNRSAIECFDIGLMLGSMANSFCENSITGVFGTRWMVVPMSKRSGILANVMDMRSRADEVGLTTNGYTVIDYLLDNDIAVDRILLFTDCQMWDSYHDRNLAPTFVKYQRANPGTKLYTFDLVGYGGVVMPQGYPGVCAVGGWSDRIFDFIQMFEGTGYSAIDEIKAITP